MNNRLSPLFLLSFFPSLSVYNLPCARGLVWFSSYRQPGGPGDLSLSTVSELCSSVAATSIYFEFTYVSKLNQAPK